MDETIRLNRLLCPIGDLKHTKHPFLPLSLTLYSILFSMVIYTVRSLMFCLYVCVCVRVKQTKKI